MDAIFDTCVRLLHRWADRFGVSYKQINVWIFCVVWPAITMALLAVILMQQLYIWRNGP